MTAMPSATIHRQTPTSGLHSFELRDPIEVDTPHGRGVVLYITVYGVHGNDMWCVANKQDGRMRHYETTQIQLAFNGALNMNPPVPARQF
jgi:hypothetical protein